MLKSLATYQSWLTQELGSLQPWQLESLIEAMKRHVFEKGTPVNGFSGQPTISTIVNGWTQV